MFNEILALALIPSFINPENFQNQNGSIGDVIETNPLNSNYSILTERLLEELVLPVSENEGVTNSMQQLASTNTRRNDPLLTEVNEEVRRLELEFPDDYFDHLEDKSEEVRKLIRSRQEAVQIHSFNHYDHEGELVARSGRSRSNLDDDQPSTEFPLLFPVTESPDLSSTVVGASEIPTTTTLQPSTAPSKKPGVIGSAISEIHQGASSIFGTISRPFKSNGLFGRKKTSTTTTTTTTTTTPVPSPPETMIITESTTLSEPVNCTLEQTEYKGQCYNVLQQLPCPDGEWLIEDPSTGKGKCVVNQCANRTNTALYGNRCIEVGKKGECHIGMVTIIYKSGVVECDCKQGYLYNERNGNCYKAYTQGPCQTGQYFIIPPTISSGSGSKTNKATCMPNPCVTDGSFCNAPRCPKLRNCAKLGDECNTNARFAIHPDTNSPHCLTFGQFDADDIIGNVPTLSCAPGSRRDILGNCRTPTEINFS